MKNTVNVVVELDGVDGIAPHTKLELTSGIAVLTGKNNVGKSRLLKSCAELGLKCKEDLSTLPRIKYSSNINNKEYRLDIFKDQSHSIFMHDPLKRTPAELIIDKNGSHSFKTFDNTSGSGHLGSLDNLIKNVYPTEEFTLFYSRLKDIIYIDPQRVVKPIVETIPKKVPSPDGSDLAQAIYTHRNENTREYNVLSDLISGMFKEISGIFTVPSGTNQVTLSLRDNFANKNISLSECGTGIAQALHLASMILFSEPGKIFLIDEPHVYLHPGAEKLLANFIKEHKEHKYVIATHSPIFIQAVRPDIVYLVTRGSDGTRVKESLSGVQYRTLLLEELGVNLGDMSIAEKIIFVEGKSDVDIISEMLEKTGLSNLNNNYVIFSLGESDISDQMEDLLKQLGTIVHLPYMIYLDGDKKRKGHIPESLKGLVEYCPELDIEMVLLRDPAAILTGLKEIALSMGIKTTFNIEVDDINELIQELKSKGSGEKGIKIIGDLFYKFSETKGLEGLTYMKSFGQVIARNMDKELIQDVVKPFSKFLSGLNE